MRHPKHTIDSSLAHYKSINPAFAQLYARNYFFNVINSIRLSTTTNSSTFTIHTIASDPTELPAVLDLLDTSLQLLVGHLNVSHLLVCYATNSGSAAATAAVERSTLPVSQIAIRYARTGAALLAHMPPAAVPLACGGPHRHCQRRWREFFVGLEPLKAQCLAAGRRLVAVMGEIRASDHQGVPSRRQLFAQHRALSRALMDPDLQNLRRKGSAHLVRLAELLVGINSADTGDELRSGETQPAHKMETTADASDVCVRLSEVNHIFEEVDRAARRLEQLTEQRRERLRELTHQRTLEDEINEVSTQPEHAMPALPAVSVGGWLFCVEATIESGIGCVSHPKQ